MQTSGAAVVCVTRRETGEQMCFIDFVGSSALKQRWRTVRGSENKNKMIKTKDLVKI